MNLKYAEKMTNIFLFDSFLFFWHSPTYPTHPPHQALFFVSLTVSSFASPFCDGTISAAVSFCGFVPGGGES